MGKKHKDQRFDAENSVTELTLEAGRVFSFPGFRGLSNNRAVIRKIYTPAAEAVQEIKKRRQDPALMERVAAYLNDDIPEHFNNDKPVFYLSRHLATPNFEAIQAADIAGKHELPLVVGEDIKGKFTPHNELKRSLAKMPIIRGFSHNGDEIIEYFTVVDFSKTVGKSFTDIRTVFGQSLPELHKELFSELFGARVSVYDESAWIDRNFRGDIFMQYKKMLALLCVHGIMLESYPKKEYQFALDVVLPAIMEVTKELGVKPLIVEHISESQEHERDWNSYPSALYQIVKRKYRS